MISASALMPQLVASPCGLPLASLDELLADYGALGFAKWEGFSEWARARFDWTQDAAPTRQKMARAGFGVTSFHLPPLRAAEPERSLEDALQAAQFAAGLGARVVLLKAEKRDLFGQFGPRFLDALENENIPVTPVVQNHRGTAITTLDDYREVWESLDYDPRLHAVLEVGHFERVGISWRQGWEALGERVALVHLNDIKDGESVPYGTGDVDFAGLLGHIKTAGYRGDIVVELELPSRGEETAQTLAELGEAVSLLEKLYAEA